MSLVNMETHLRSKQYYEDSYDRITIAGCRQREAFFLGSAASEDDDAYTKLKAGTMQVAWEIEQIYLTLDWYNKRESTINEWMHKDKARDMMLAVAHPPRNVFCSTCAERMNEDSRTIWDRGSKEQVLFFMRCIAGHMPMKGVFEDGVELVIEDKLCPKCNAVLNSSRLPSKKGVIKTKISCSACNFEEVDEFALSSDEPVEDPSYEADRLRFCLTGENLKKAQDEVFRMEQMSRLVQGWKHKEVHKAEYDAVSKLEKLTIPQVKERISTVIEGKGYLNLVFEKPSIERYVSLEFSVEEMQTENERMSTSNLHKLLKKSLSQTNWRVMTDGINYRLGLLTGRIRAYESKEDLLKLVAK
jgi:C4-type Zn-finger protein